MTLRLLKSDISHTNTTVGQLGETPETKGWRGQERGGVIAVGERYWRTEETRREAAVVNDRDKKWQPGHRGALERGWGEETNSSVQGVQNTIDNLPLSPCQCQCLQRLSRLCRVILLLLAGVAANASARRSGWWTCSVCLLPLCLCWLVYPLCFCLFLHFLIHKHRQPNRTWKHRASLMIANPFSRMQPRHKAIVWLSSQTLFPLLLLLLLLRSRFCMFSLLKLNFLFYLHRVAFFLNAAQRLCPLRNPNRKLLFHLVA